MNKVVYILSAIIGAAASCGFTLSSADASSLVRECRAGSASQVVACCQNHVRENGRPFWMRSADASCRELTIKCSEKKGSRVCAPARITHVDRGGDRPGSGGNNPISKNNPTGGNNPNGGNSPTRSATGAPK